MQGAYLGGVPELEIWTCRVGAGIMGQGVLWVT